MCSINIAVPSAVPGTWGCSGHFPDKKQPEGRKEGRVTFGSHFQGAALHGGEVLQQEHPWSGGDGWMLALRAPSPRPVACVLLLTFRAEPSIPSNAI